MATRDSGHVRIYEYSGTDWIQLGSDIRQAAGRFEWGQYPCRQMEPVLRLVHHIIMATEQIQDMFVYTSIEVLIGFKGGDINGKAGADQSGSSVSLSSDGTRIAIGAPNNDGTGQDQGHVRIRI
jgi:hypothetical protein